LTAHGGIECQDQSPLTRTSRCKCARLLHEGVDRAAVGTGLGDVALPGLDRYWFSAHPMKMCAEACRDKPRSRAAALIPRRLEQARLRKFPRQVVGQLARDSFSYICRDIFGCKIAPALEWSARQPLGADNVWLQHQPAPHDALGVAEGPYVQQLLAALHAALHHPIERSAIGEFINPLGDHACGVELFSRLPAPLFVFKGELDPLLKLFGRGTADAKFDHVKRHALPLAEMRDRVNAGRSGMRKSVMRFSARIPRNSNRLDRAIEI